MSEIVMLPSPTPCDTAELHFKLVSRIKAITYNEKFTCANLLAVSPSFGLVFIATVDGFIVAKTNDIIENPFPQKYFHVRCRPVTNLAVNSNETYLAVGGNVLSKGCVAYLYFIQNNLQGAHKVELNSTAGVVICDLVWNPAIPQLLSACLSDGSVVVVEFKEKSFELNSLPPAAAARCLCWSPKGKQIVVGGEDGKLIQYKPDLKPAKVLPAPELFGGTVAVVNVLWVSNFQFAAFYRHRTDHNFAPVLVIVNANKNEPVTFINYEDVTYGSTNYRFPQFYFHHIQAWNMIVISSANSVELAVMQLSEDGKYWQQQVVGDSSRVEMPLSDTQDETYPLGMALDLTSHSPIPWPQAEMQLPPMPRLLFITNEGKLCLYNVVNLKPNIPQICAPPSAQYPDSFFTIPAVPTEEKEVIAPVAAPAPAPPPPKQEPIPVREYVPLVLAPPPPPPSYVPPPPEQQSFPTTLISSRNEITTPPQEQQLAPPPTAVEDRLESPLSPVVETEVDDAVYNAAIWEEVDALNEIFDVFKIEMSSNNVELVPLEEFCSVVKSLDCLVDFEKDVEDTSNSQAEEISELKFDVLELSAKVEDSRLVSNRRSSKLSTQLRRSEQLDPVMARTLREILALKTFIENQLSQINDHLDRQWEDYRRSCRKNAKDTLEIPMMEDIFKTLNLHKKLISVKRAQLETLQKEIEHRSFLGSWQANSTQPSTRATDSNRTAELSKLADSLLGMSIQTNDKIDKDAIKNLTLESKRLSLMADELSIADLTLLLDRFEDAEVPTVSHALSYAEREAHKKEVAQRIKNTSERIKSKKKEDLKKQMTYEKETKKLSDKSKSNVHASNTIFQISSKSDLQAGNAYSIPSLTSKTSLPVGSTEQIRPETNITEKPLTSWQSKLDANVQSKPTVSPVLTGLLTKTSPIIRVPEGTTVQKVTPIPETFPKTAAPPTTTAFAGYGSLKLGANTSTSFVPTSQSTNLFAPQKTSMFGNISAPFSFGENTTSLFGATKITSTGTTTPTSITISKVSDTTPSSINDVILKTISTESVVTTPKVEYSFGAAIEAQTFDKQITSSQEKKTDKMKGLFGSSGMTPVAQPVSAAEVVKSSIPAAVEPTSIPSPTLSTPPTEPIKVITPSNTPSQSAQITSTSSLAPVVSTPAESKLGMFGSLTTTPASTSEGLFSNVTPTSGNVFGGFSTSPLASKTTELYPAANLFGLSESARAAFRATTTTPGSITTTTPSTTTTSTTTESITIETITPSTSLFNKPVTTTVASPLSIGLFSATTTSAVSTDLFSKPLFTTTANTTSAPLFGSSFGQATTATTGLFGSSTTPTTATSGLFGSSTTPTTATSGLFGASTTSTTATSGLFGSSTTPTTATSGLFGSSTTSTTATSGLFGSSTTSTTATSGLFGSSTTPTTTSSGLFGSSTTPTTQSTFGADLNQTTNIFGQMLEVSPAAPPNTGLFGQETPTKTGFDSGGNIFGNSTPANTASSIFGSSSPSSYGQAQSGSLFGGTTASSNIFAQTPATTSSAFFGQNICSPFVSSAPAPNQSPFGTPAATNQNVFASSTSVFGQSSFGQNQTSSIFGGSSGGTVASSGSIFGGNASVGFQSSFSGGSFSGGNNSVAQSGFGAPAAFSKPAVGGFGSAPIFGGTAAPTTFGGTPAFASSSPFGSPSKVFGSTNPQGAVFGQSAGSAGFEALGNQSTLGFGNIAQQGFGSTGFGSPQQNTFGNQPQQQQQQQQQSSSFGSSSFSSWR